MAAVHGESGKRSYLTLIAVIAEVSQAVALALIVSLLLVYFTTRGHYDPPFQSLEVFVMTRTVEPGGVVHAVYTNQRNYTCAADIVRFLRPENPDYEVIRLPPVRGGYSEIGINEVHVAIEIPEDTRPGVWSYIANVVSYCEGEVYTAQTPPATFEVRS